MGTWSAIFVQTNDFDGLTNKLQQLSGIHASHKGKYPTADLFHNMLMSDNANPTYMVMAQTQPDWVMIRHNGFKGLEDWGKDLSAQFATKVIISCAQSNVDFYHFSLYDGGETRRVIEYCYGEDYTPINTGGMFDFENEQPGQRVTFNGETEYTFDFDSIESYGKHFDLQVHPDYDSIEEWTIIKGSPGSQAIRGDFSAQTKPWWKFW
jgi:hypothetical protein